MWALAPDPVGREDTGGMPVERRSSSAQIRSILIAVVSVVFVATLGYAVFRAATGESTSVTSGASDGTWNTGSAESKAEAIAEDGPILIPDPAGAQRLPIFISHAGDNPKKGWHAFEARPPGAPDDCFLEWDADAEVFRGADPSCGDDTFPLDGEGLRSFEATVDKGGDLIIDFTP